MNVNEFCLSAATNQSLADYLDELATDATAGDEHRSIGIDLFFAVAASLLYLYVRNKLDFKRGLNNAELRPLMEREIERLVENGYPREEVLAAVLSVNKAIEVRPPDDSLIKTALSLIAAGKGTASAE